MSKLRSNQPQERKGFDEKNSRLFFHPSFADTIEELRKKRITLPSIPLELDLDFKNYGFPSNGELVISAEQMKSSTLDPRMVKFVQIAWQFALMTSPLISFRALKERRF